MTATANPSTYDATALEIKAESLATLLRAGLEDDFGRQFQRETKTMDTKLAEALVELINLRLAGGIRKRHLRIMLSHQSSSITLVDRSRFFGDSFAVARQTFAM